MEAIHLTIFNQRKWELSTADLKQIFHKKKNSEFKCLAVTIIG